MKVAIGRAYLTVWRYHHVRCDWQMAQHVLRGCDFTDANARRHIAGIMNNTAYTRHYSASDEGHWTA